MSLVEMLNIFVVKPSSPPVPSCSLILCQPLPWPALPIGHLNLVRSFVDCDMPHLLGRDACGQRFVVGVPGSPGQMSFMQCEVSVSAASPRGAPGWPASSTGDQIASMQVAVDGGQGGYRDCVARLQSRQSAVSHPGISVLLGTTLSLVELVALCLAGAGVATTDVVPGAGVLPDCVDVLEGVQPPPLRRCEADLAEP